VAPAHKTKKGKGEKRMAMNKRKRKN